MFVMEKEGKEYLDWIKKAESDLRTAEKSFKINEYGWANFQIQQSIEKALKSILIKEKEKLIKSHDLVFLSKLVKLPENLKKYCKKITIFYTLNRYPDVGGEKLNSQDTKKYLQQAKEILKWVKKKI